MSPHVKLTCLLALVLTLPVLTALALLETGRASQAQALLAVHGAMSVGLLPFIARLALRLCVYADLKEVNDFAARVRRGSFPAPFDLPVEREDEHQLLRLKRNLNWMLHMLCDRETRLLKRLEETDQARRALEGVSRRDPLTGLLNRRALDETMACLHATPGAAAPWLVLIDCDKFKQVNDCFGHQSGDEVLRVLAATLLESVRDGQDLAFRLGGDEFAVLLDCSPQRAREVAGRIRLRFKERNGRGCTLSMGMAAALRPCPDNPACMQACLSAADAAMYRAKALGGDRLCSP